MRNSILIMVALFMISTVFSSCTKFYNCECTDHQGNISLHVVKAKDKIQADRRCDSKGPLSNCDIK